mmetsp:Transcript_29932/g.45812  ORF Transcript_29932/g.45812 Transcript_29932/m.45812 type:complete len:466 (+) Transcript_29932:1011-2408(+)
MGSCNSRETREQRDERMRKEGREEGREKEREERNRKSEGTYWHRMKDVWRFESAGFGGRFEKGLELRQRNVVALYQEVHDILMNGEGIEAYLNGEDPMSVFSDAVITMDTKEHSLTSTGNRTENTKHEKKHGKDFLGEYTASTDVSRAHAFPKDTECNIWWWPEFLLVTGHHGTKTQGKFEPLDDTSKEALNKFAAMRTNKIVFPGQHNHIFDTLKHGTVCAIPIFDSLEEMAKWQYKDGYKLLIVCDNAKAYQQIKMDEETRFKHIHIASKDEVEKATQRVGEMMMILAESLVTNWKGYYDSFDPTSRKRMMSRMHESLAGSITVDIPKYNLPEGAVPMMYVIDYADLYADDEEGAKYIHDPMPALIKAAVNASAFVNGKKGGELKDCKLLPACSDGEDEESESSFDIIDLVYNDRANTSVPREIFPKSTTSELVDRKVVHVISDDEKEDEERDSLSVGSDLTY